VWLNFPRYPGGVLPYTTNYEINEKTNMMMETYPAEELGEEKWDGGRYK
jgi:hypothetical protein